MHLYRTKDNKVSKYLHEDESETCIKTVYSVDYKPNPNTGEVDVTSTDRNKYSVFVSASQGCPMNCPFCYLTIDNVPYKKLSYQDIVDNVTNAIWEESTNLDANIEHRFIKICWMAMGEGILNPQNVRAGTKYILDWAMARNLTKGLDGVDISSVIPKISDKWVDEFVRLNYGLQSYPLNPNNKNVVNRERGDLVEYKNRSRFRFFYSLHSAIQKSRDVVVPNALPIIDVIPQLRELQNNGVNVIIHHMFMDGMNDNEQELEALVDFMQQFPENELRILRYNRNERSNIIESKTFEQCVCFLQQHLKNIKVQVSYGKDVKSACGQFIYNTTNELEDLKIM